MANKAKQKTKRFYVVECKTHGMESDKWAGRMVKVGRPLHKRDSNSGCPLCAAEARAAIAA